MTLARRSYFVLLLVVAAFALPSLARDREPLIGIVDLQHHRVLLPEGSVVAFGMEFRAQPLRGPNRMDPSERRPGARVDSSAMTSIMQRTNLTPPLAVEYAP